MARSVRRAQRDRWVEKEVPKGARRRPGFPWQDRRGMTVCTPGLAVHAPLLLWPGWMAALNVGAAGGQCVCALSGSVCLSRSGRRPPHTTSYRPTCCPPALVPEYCGVPLLLPTASTVTPPRTAACAAVYYCYCDYYHLLWHLLLLVSTAVAYCYDCQNHILPPPMTATTYHYYHCYYYRHLLLLLLLTTPNCHLLLLSTTIITATHYY